MNKIIFNKPYLTGLLSLLFLFSVPALMAQEDEGFGFDDEGPKKVSGGVGYFTPGYHLMDQGAMNTVLSANGYEAFSNNSITLGGGGFVVIRNFIFGGEGHSFLKKEASSFDGSTNLKGGWGAFNFGYVIYGQKGLMVYPRVGIGQYNHRWTLVDGDATSSVQSQLDHDFKGTELIRKGMILSASLSADIMPGFDQSAGSGLLIGLEVGYQYRATAGNWNAYGADLSGGPDIDLGGLFFRLKIGGGGWHRQ